VDVVLCNIIDVNVVFDVILIVAEPAAKSGLKAIVEGGKVDISVEFIVLSLLTVSIAWVFECKFTTVVDSAILDNDGLEFTIAVDGDKVGIIASELESAVEAVDDLSAGEV
jgi:hypothetical protein